VEIYQLVYHGPQAYGPDLSPFHSEAQAFHLSPSSQVPTPLHRRPHHLRLRLRRHPRPHPRPHPQLPNPTTANSLNK
jgi:hypothetical protein